MSHHDPGDDSSSSDDDIVSPARCSGPATDGGHTNTFTTIGDIANQIGSQHNYGNVSIENGLSQAADAKLSELLEQVKLSRERAERRDRERESRRQQEDKQQILDSLYFPQMFTRRDMLQPAHQETYEWIFREPGNSENNDDVESSDDGEPSDADDSDDLANKDRSRSSFVTWLKESSSDIPFWIQGKPGSGKSVLMRFIERHRSLQSLLQNHVAPQPWKVISFYFWLAGTSAQKSIEGALRTLLFQMLSSHEHMMQMLDLPPRPFEWNRELLWQSIVTLIASAPTKYFILLDGLDESSEDSQALDNFVQQLKSSDQVRLLVSSRSLHNFQLMFAECPTISMQDLTGGDMRKYIRHRLERDSLRHRYVEAHDVPCLQDELVRRSEGVFLWTSLALNAMAEGMEFRESYDQLVQRLYELPQNLHAMFLSIINRCQRHHQRNGFVYLRLLHTAKSTGFEMSTLELAVIDRTCPSLGGKIRTSLDRSDILKHADVVSLVVVATCGGLVQTKPHHGRLVVFEFVHRSVLDFLNEYFSTTVPAFTSEDAYRWLIVAHQHLLRWAAHEFRLLAAINQYGLTAAHYLDRLSDTDRDMAVRLWRDFAESGRNFVQDFNEKTGFAERLELWPAIVQHVRDVRCTYGQDPDQTLLPYHRARFLEHSSAQYVHYECFGDYMHIFDEDGLALIWDFDPSVADAMPHVTTRRATYLAFACVVGLQAECLLGQSRYLLCRASQRLSGHSFVALQNCLAAGADMHMPTKTLMVDSGPRYDRLQNKEGFGEKDMTLWQLLLRILVYYSAQELLLNWDQSRYIRAMGELLAILCLFCSHGGSVQDSIVEFALDGKHLSPTVAVILTGNLTAYACYQASRNPLWIDIAHFIWELDPEVRMIRARCRWRTSPDSGYSLDLISGLSLPDCVNALANATQEERCPYQPTTQSVQAGREYMIGLSQAIEHAYVGLDKLVSEDRIELEWKVDPDRNYGEEYSTYEFEGYRFEVGRMIPGYFKSLQGSE